MHINLDHADSVYFFLTWQRQSRVDSGYARLGETFFASLIIGHWQYDCKYASNKGMPAV